MHREVEKSPHGHTASQCDLANLWPGSSGLGHIQLYCSHPLNSPGKSHLSGLGGSQAVSSPGMEETP
jgi:hypothetical protein